MALLQWFLDTENLKVMYLVIAKGVFSQSSPKFASSLPNVARLRIALRVSGTRARGNAPTRLTEEISDQACLTTCYVSYSFILLRRGARA